jgi:hypothetical protein
MRLLSAALCLAAVLSCQAALGQESAAPEPEKLAIAARILENSRAESTLNGVVNALVPRIVQDLKRRSPNMPDDVAALIGNELLQEMKTTIPAVNEIYVRVYAGRFTLAELKEIEAFYLSPVGRKMVSEMPKIVQEMQPLSRPLAERAALEALQRVMIRLRAKGMKI